MENDMRLTTRIGCLLALIVAACGGETPGELVTIELALRSEPADAESVASFETDTGYAVTLEEASVRIGPIFAFSPEALAAKSPLWERLQASFVSTAHAHGGIDLVSGRVVRAEWLEPVTLDALETETQLLGEIQAEQGVVDAITLELSRGGREGAQIVVRGAAEQDEAQLSFEGALTLEDDPVSARRVELVHEDIEITEGGRLTIVVHPDRWLRGAELARAPVEDGVATISADSQPGRAFAIAARSPAAFSIEWRP
jgi:hypothetical protein